MKNVNDIQVPHEGDPVLPSMAFLTTGAVIFLLA